MMHTCITNNIESNGTYSSLLHHIVNHRHLHIKFDVEVGLHWIEIVLLHEKLDVMHLHHSNTFIEFTEYGQGDFAITVH